MHPPVRPPATPAVIPINNPAQREPPLNVSGASPAPGPQDIVQPVPAPNPEPPTVAVDRAEAALAKDAALSGKGKGVPAKSGKGKTKAREEARRAGGKVQARSYGSIGEEPIETHRMDTPPKEPPKGADRKRNRIGDSIRLLQQNYRAKRQSTKGRNKNAVNQAEQMLKSGKSAGGTKRGAADFSSHTGKGEGDTAKRARAGREANEYARIQGAQRGIDISDMLR